jgi:hypothetical protein
MTVKMDSSACPEFLAEHLDGMGGVFVVLGHAVTGLGSSCVSGSRRIWSAAGSRACPAWKSCEVDGWLGAGISEANITTPALERWLWSRRSFEQLLVPDAIPRPRQSVEPFRIDRPAVDQALSIGAVLDSSQRILHLLKNCRVELRFGEVLAFRLVGDARVASIRSSVDQLLASRFDVACCTT